MLMGGIEPGVLHGAIGLCMGPPALFPFPPMPIGGPIGLLIGYGLVRLFGNIGIDLSSMAEARELCPEVISAVV